MRHDSHKKAKLTSSWRKPRGLQNKVRLKKRGYRAPISIGSGHARKDYGKVQGLQPVLVSTLSDMDAVGKGQGVLIARVGTQRLEQLLKLAKEKKLTVLNHDVDASLKRIADIRAERKKEKSAAKKAPEPKKETKKAESSEQKEDPDDSKKSEEKQKQKVLTKKV